MNITDQVAKVLAEIDARKSAIEGNWPDERRALECLKAVTEGLLALRKEWADAAEWMQIPAGTGSRNLQDCVADCDDQLTTLCDQWEAKP